MSLHEFLHSLIQRNSDRNDSIFIHRASKFAGVTVWTKPGRNGRCKMIATDSFNNTVATRGVESSERADELRRKVGEEIGRRRGSVLNPYALEKKSND